MKHPLFETFFSTFLGIFIGTLTSLYFEIDSDKNIIFTIIASGTGAVLFPTITYFIRKSNNNLLQKILVLSTFPTIFVIFFLIIYLTLDNKNYSPHQTLYITKNVNLREIPGKYDKEEPLILEKGTQVTYLSKTNRRYKVSRQLPTNEWKSYFNFWRQVKTKNGITGWVYGAYVSKSRQHTKID